ncbi:hypothetical protein I9W82_004430 [Candida metapsilosis]|uniref:Uncharacterized protein n=1 Tax=Candida metapsilosis TaxID=273372 RepID=A0A8H8DBT8_9ASCO|nr:hypothetical protein I9W82_004430 [Candida metapsilosis]
MFTTSTSCNSTTTTTTTSTATTSAISPSTSLPTPNTTSSSSENSKLLSTKSKPPPGPPPPSITQQQEEEMANDTTTSNKVSAPAIAAQQQNSPTKPQTLLHPPESDSSTESHKRKTSTISPSNISPPTSCGSTASTTTTGSSSSFCNSAITQASKRHKPMTLNLNPATTLSSNTNADLALRIVSPGLPALDDEMKSTIKLSQKIQQQQRYLIASRRGVDIDDDNGETFIDDDVIVEQQVAKIVDEDSNLAQSATPLSSISSKSQRISSPITSEKPSSGKTTLSFSAQENKENATITTSPVTSGTNKSPIYALDDSDITRLSSLKNRRMKRKNIPTPLNIGASSNTAQVTASSKPKVQIAPLSIRSAPIRSAPMRPTLNLRSRGGAVGGGMIGKPSRLASTHLVPPGSSSAYRYPMHPSQVHTPQQQQQQQPYYYLPPPRTAQLSNSNVPQMAYPARQGRPFPPQQQQHAQFHNTLPRGVRLVPAPSAATAQQFPMRYMPIVPPSSTMLNFQHRQYQQQMHSSQPQREKRSTTEAGVGVPRPGAVTDVFSDNLQRVAPLQSQPLSSQVEFFKRANVNPSSVDKGDTEMSNENDNDDAIEVDEEDDDKAPVSQDEIDEMQQKYASSRKVVPQYVPNFQQQQLLQQQQQQQQQQMQFQGAGNVPMMMMAPNVAPPAAVPNVLSSSPLSAARQKGEVFGSINFMNESIFNFRIFERKNKQNEEDHDMDKPSSTEVDYDAEKNALSSSSSGGSASSQSSAGVGEANDNLKSPEEEAKKSKTEENEESSKEGQDVNNTKDSAGTSDVEQSDVDVAPEKEEQEPKDEEKEVPQEEEQGEPSRSKLNNESDDDDWLRYEKEKFMKICETCWDEYVKIRNLQQ